MRNGQQKLLAVIQDCHEALEWLHGSEGTNLKEAPDEYVADLKQLDKLGIVYKRNNRSLGIRWQRLRKLAERGTPTGSIPYNTDDILMHFKGPETQAV